MRILAAIWFSVWLAVVVVDAPAKLPAKVPRSDKPAAPLASATPESGLTAWEQRLVDAINDDRANHGLEPLAVHPDLMRCARDRSMVMTNWTAHEPGGVWPHEAAREYGYRFTRIGENYAPTFDTPESAVRGWQQSPGHARTMRGDFVHVGVGVGRGHNFVAMFGKP